MDLKYIKAMIGEPSSEKDGVFIWLLDEKKTVVNLGKDEIFVEKNGKRENHTMLTLVYFLSPYRKTHYIPYPNIFISHSLEDNLRYLHIENHDEEYTEF